MASTRIPPELFDNILACVEDKHDLVHDYENRYARGRTRRYLSNCSSVCLHWAKMIRPRMFKTLVLRSAQDLYGLLALLPCSSPICSIAHYLQRVVVFYRFTDYFWLHDLQRLQANAPRKELSLRIHISGPAPCIRNKKRTARHPLYNTVPRVVPIHRNLLLHVVLIIRDVKFPDGAGLVNLLRDISYFGILPRSIHCERLEWDDKLALSFVSLDPTFPLNPHLHVKPFYVTINGCTDDFLVAFAAHSYIARRESGASMLSSSDSNRFLGLFSKWARMARNGDTFQVIHNSPLFGREGINQISQTDRGTTGYLWRLQTRERFFDGTPYRRGFEFITELGFCMRPEQGHGLGSSQTAYICSIVIGLYDDELIRKVDGNFGKTFLQKALEFPMLDTITLSFLRLHQLRDFVNRHRAVLAIAESQGRLRLYLNVHKEIASQREHWRQQDLSDVLDAIDKSDSEKEFENESESLQEDLPAESLQSDAVIESERVLNKETSHLLSSAL